MILQGDPKGIHVFAHVTKKREVLKVGMGDGPSRTVGSVIALTPIAEERLWRLLNERRDAALSTTPKV